MKGSNNSNAKVHHWQDTRTDYFSGTREALVAEGVCKLEWFPEKLLPALRKDGQPHKRWGRESLRRTYVVEGRNPETILQHKLDAFGEEQWLVRIAVSEAETESRQAEERRKEEERDRHLTQQERDTQRIENTRRDEEERARLEQLSLNLRSLPPFVPGSMSESEKHHMRIVRGLDENSREYIFEITERLLSRPLTENQGLGDQRRAGLQLVVDNEFGA
jgi:hypothetical protein